MNKDYQRIEKAIHYLEQNLSDQPGLDQLSNVIHVSPYHLQRTFKRWAGVTPKQFLKCITLKMTNFALRNGESTLTVSEQAGFSSSSRLHDLYVNFHAMSPAQYRNKGQGLTIKFGFGETPFGKVVIGMTDKGICSLFFSTAENIDSAKVQLEVQWPNATLLEDDVMIRQTIAEIFSKENYTSNKINVHVGGSNFQMKVWQALLQIPFAKVSNYGQIATSIGSSGASRAVGSAIGKNPIALLIPCHRVIRSTGVIGDYHWGGTRKKAILTWEQCQLSA